MNGAKRPVSGPYVCVKDGECDSISAERMCGAVTLNINKGGTARRDFMPCPLKGTGLFFCKEARSMAIRHLVLMRLKPGVFTPEAR